MGYDAERAQDLVDQYKAGLIDANGDPVDAFDVPDDFDPTKDAAQEPTVKRDDPARPEAVRGYYHLPNPATGKMRRWSRVTNFVKKFEDPHHLGLWKQRNVAKGVAMLALDREPSFLRDLAVADVKEQRERLNKIAEKAQEVAEAYKMADEGTALHTSTELADYAGGDITKVPSHHRPKVSLYLDALAANGLKVADGMIERVTVSTEYEAAGKFDRIYIETDDSHVIGDLKTGDSLDLAFPAIAAQLDAYRNGINVNGVWDGRRYDTSIKVRDDYGIVVHLPSTRDEVTVYRVDLHQGRLINEGNLHVKLLRRVKAKHVAAVYEAVTPLSAHEQHWYWVERLNACHTYEQMVAVAGRARSFGQWTDRLAFVARNLTAEINAADAVMGS